MERAFVPKLLMAAERLELRCGGVDLAAWLVIEKNV